MPAQVLDWKNLPLTETIHLTTPEKEDGGYKSYLTVGNDAETREPVYLKTPVCNGSVTDDVLTLDLGQDFPDLVSVTKDFESKCADVIVENSTTFFGGKRFTKPRMVESLVPSFDNDGNVRVGVKHEAVQIRDQYDRVVPLSLLKPGTPMKIKVHIDEVVQDDDDDDDDEPNDNNNNDNESFF
ncbi:hypothetical protein HK102_002441 [Quaeritorhiza haematococci]|nr:hypothetical protein HK102_002441 [Quaeritorhiza haematococci]